MGSSHLPTLADHDPRRCVATGQLAVVNDPLVVPQLVASHEISEARDPAHSADSAAGMQMVCKHTVYNTHTICIHIQPFMLNNKYTLYTTNIIQQQSMIQYDVCC